MTERTLHNWQMAAEKAHAPARVGRPPASPATCREALRLVRREMRVQGKTAGWRPIAAALEGRVSTRLVQRTLAAWKQRAARRLEAVRLENRSSLEPKCPNVLWSLDAMQVGRVEGHAVLVEQVVEVTTTETLGLCLGQSIGGEKVVHALEAAVLRQGAPPLVVATDGGGENLSRLVLDWCEQNAVVRLVNVPRTPEHNPWVERKHRDVRAESGLCSGTRLGSCEEAGRRVEAALWVLDRGRRRRKLGYRTAAAGDSRPATVYSRAERERLCAAVADAVRAARRNCARLRDRRRAEREATVRVLVDFGLLRWTRGGVPVQTVKAEIIS